MHIYFTGKTIILNATQFLWQEIISWVKKSLKKLYSYFRIQDIFFTWKIITYYISKIAIHKSIVPNVLCIMPRIPFLVFLSGLFNKTIKISVIIILTINLMSVVVFVHFFTSIIIVFFCSTFFQGNHQTTRHNTTSQSQVSQSSINSNQSNQKDREKKGTQKKYIRLYINNISHAPFFVKL